MAIKRKFKVKTKGKPKHNAWVNLEREWFQFHLMETANLMLWLCSSYFAKIPSCYSVIPREERTILPLSLSRWFWLCVHGVVTCLRVMVKVWNLLFWSPCDYFPSSNFSEDLFFEKLWVLLFKNWFMLSVRISSYGCTREVWRARKKRKSCSRRSREQL